MLYIASDAPPHSGQCDRARVRMPNLLFGVLALCLQGLLLSPLHGRLSDGVVQSSYFLSCAVDDRLFVPCAYLVVHFWVLCEQLRLCMRRPGRCIAREDTGCPFEVLVEDTAV